MSFAGCSAFEVSVQDLSLSMVEVNHPQLAAMLCPVKYLSEYQKDPQE
jgi:hypothetical protein